MYFAGVITIFFVFLNFACSHISIKQGFKDSKIVPDILKDYPPEPVEVFYRESGLAVKMGNVLTPTDVINQPEVDYKGKSAMFYTLLMVDPDAPSAKEPKAREWQHWLVGNIPGNKLASGQVFTEYVGAAPPKYSGYHRYVFIVFEHNNKKDFKEPIRKNNNGKRSKFHTEEFALKYGLGKPFAGNYFKAQYDDSVPTIQKQLGF